VDESTISRRRPDCGHKDKLTHESACKRMKQRGRNSFKKNYSPSGEEWYENDDLDEDSRGRPRSSFVESRRRHVRHYRNPGCLKPEKFDGTT